MSWQAYVDTSLIGSGQVDKAAIFDVLGTSCWAASPGFTLKPDEVRAIASSFTNLTQVMATGFHLQGEKYMAVRAEATCIVGKKGKTGAVIVKTKQALLVAHHGENVLTTNCSNTVESLGNYLISLGY